MPKISDHFTEDELNCNCAKCKNGNGYGFIQRELLDRLEAARNLANFPFKVSSWCRCPTHNYNSGGSDTSSHLEGWAVDIAVIKEKTKFLLVFYLMLAGFTRIGIGKDFIHIDCDPAKRPNIMWFY